MGARKRRRQLALLLPGHNEELIIATTIRSAVAAGQNLKDIYVVDDGSTDNTRAEALTMLSAHNILSLPHTGKAKAISKAINHFAIDKRYSWVHVADADSVFCPNYFYHYKRKLSKKYVVAVGFVQSMRGNWIARYRCFSYTYGQHIFRRIQSWLGMISVFPGPVTCFRTDILHKLDFSAESLTEDFDLTLQVHRKKLGKIRFIPEAVNYTQDPRTLRDFCKQTTRWQRGFFQGVRKYQIGFHRQRIDISIMFQLLETLLYLVQLFVVMPYLAWRLDDWRLVVVVLTADYLVLCVLALLSAAAARRPAILFALPYFHFLRIIELAIFIKAFVEIIALGKFRSEITGWETKGRRYKLNDNALQDTAQ